MTSRHVRASLAGDLYCQLLPTWLCQRVPRLLASAIGRANRANDDVPSMCGKTGTSTLAWWHAALVQGAKFGWYTKN